MRHILKFIFLLAFLATCAFGENYYQGNQFYIKAKFDQNLSASSTMTVVLNNGDSVTLNTIVNSVYLQGLYTCPAYSNRTIDLKVDSIAPGASVRNSSGTAFTSYEIPFNVGILTAENSLIYRNLGDFLNISLNTYPKTATVPANPYGVSAPYTFGVGTSWPNETYVFVANQGAGKVTKIRTDYDTPYVYNSITVGSEPYGLVLVDVGGTPYIYVANTGSNTVSVINILNNSVVATINVGIKPYYIAHSNGKVFCTNSLTNDVSVIDTSNNTVVATVPVQTYPRSLTIYNGNVYVANFGDENYGGGNTVSVFSASSPYGPAPTIKLGLNQAGPRGVTLAQGSYILTSNFATNNVTVINGSNNTVVTTIAVGKGPRGILAVDSYNKVYVENFDDSSITVINSTNWTVSATVKVGHSPSGMNRVGNKLVFTSFQDNRVYFLDIPTDTVAAY